MINHIRILVASSRRRAGLFTLFVCIILASVIVGRAQEPVIPNFWDKHERFVKPDMSNVARLRFLTTTDFPPFNFVDRSKRLAGFHVDLAKAICRELGLLQRCQIQALPWEELGPALAKGDGEAIIAGIAITAESREKYDFSKPYFHVPGRFVALNSSNIGEPLYGALENKTVGVIKGSSHEAYFQNVFTQRKVLSFDTRRDALIGMQQKKVDAVFSDGISLAFWLASQDSRNCCGFVGGPYLSEKYFGMGMAIALPKGEDLLRNGIDYALKTINDKDQFGELYLRYFPVGLY